METTSIKEVARQAGVSLGTVSNVLNRPEVVAETTRQRVLDTIAALGLRAQRLGPAAAGRAQPHRGDRGARRGQPVLHRRGTGRRGGDRGGRIAGGGVQQRRGRRPRAPPSRPARAAAGPGRAHHAGGRRAGRRAGPPGQPRDPGGPGRPRLGPARPLLGRGRRCPRWTDGRRPPAGAGPRRGRVRRRTDVDPAGGRPAQGLHRRAARSRRRPYRRHAHADRRRRPPGRGGDRRPRPAASGRPPSSAPTTCSPSACCRR